MTVQDNNFDSLFKISLTSVSLTASEVSPVNAAVLTSPYPDPNELPIKKEFLLGL